MGTLFLLTARYSLLLDGTVGSRQLQEDMNAAIEVNKLKPEIDATSFHFDDLMKAYTFFQSGQHYGKVVVDFD